MRTYYLKKTQLEIYAMLKVLLLLKRVVGRG